MRLTTFSLASLLTLTSTAALADTSVQPEQGFTIPLNARTPIVLKTAPDAACDLHAQGASAHSLKLYANGDGYVKVQVTPSQDSQADARLQLDCTAAGQVATYPLRLRTGASPTADMPAPQSVMPTPQGSQILPALTAADAQQLSDADLMRLGYATRPDVVASPEAYAKWLDHVSQPLTLLPAHLVSHANIRHQPIGVQASTESQDDPNWSGYVADYGGRSYEAVHGEWNVPEVVANDPGNSTSSALWVGLDGYSGYNDLAQAGTEQDSSLFYGIGYVAGYSAWTELLPNQPTEQGVSLSPNPGDEMEVEVWIGAQGGAVNQNGQYANASIIDWTQHNSVLISTPLSGTYFYGATAEWIMERPFNNGYNGYTLLSDFPVVS
jgi:hypothetical protein